MKQRYIQSKNDEHLMSFAYLIVSNIQVETNKATQTFIDMSHDTLMPSYLPVQCILILWFVSFMHTFLYIFIHIINIFNQRMNTPIGGFL